MLGDGRCVELFKLLWVLRRKGGYGCVSKNGLWTALAEEFCLGLEVTSSLKLIFVKYLYTLDRWLEKIFRDKGIGRGLSNCSGNLGLLFVVLETELKGLLSKMSDQNKIDEEHTRLNSEKNEFLLSATGNLYNLHEVRIVMDLGCSKKIVDNDEESVVLDQSAINDDLYTCKRKRECLSEMLNWVTDVAKNPGDTTIGRLPGSKWKVYGDQEFWVQALLAREALFMRRHVCMTAEQSLFQKRQKMHPSMYEDHIGGNNHSTEGLRCSQRLLSQKKSHSRSCSESSSATQSDLEMSLTPCMAVLESHPNKQSFVTVDSLTANRIFSLFGGDHLRRYVAVGPLFQAEVPDWTGSPLESNSKWLGTQIWPQESGEHNLLIERHPIGKGRQHSCFCELPGSVECVRIHITNKRMRLKLELGSAFHHWRFNHMGEEVSLSWTEEEERRFQAIVRLNPPSMDKCFWDQIFKCFPTRKRRDLVSYYFNVFLLRRRSYQNRVTPYNIDSDDDESEFGLVSNGFGHEAVEVAGSMSVLCAQNNQCIDLEEHT